MNIRTRMIAGCSALLFLLFTVAMLGLWSEMEVRKDVETLLNEDIAVGRAALEMKYTLTRIRQKEKSLFISIGVTGDDNPANNKKEFDEYAQELEQAVSDFAKLPLSPELSALQQQMPSQINTYKQAVEGIYQQINAGTITVASQADQQLLPFKKPMYELKKAVEGAAEQAEKEEARTKLHLEEQAARVQTIIISLIIFAGLLGAAVAVWLTRSILRPIEQIRSEITRIERNHDLTNRISYQGKDELGTTAEAFNSMLDALSNTLNQIQTRSASVHQYSEYLSSMSAQVRESTTQQTEHASQVSASVVDISNNVTHVSELSLDAQQLSVESGASAKQGVQQIQNMVRDISQIANSIGNAAKSAEELDASSDRISGITAVIKDVADQTNLLALNAAIEAARAGEQGRGFAVVADEVRKLAEKTSQSALEISQMIASIQQGAKMMAQQMRESVNYVEGGQQIAQAAGTSIEAISERTQQVVQRIDEVSGALKEQAQSSQQVSSAVRQISNAIAENTQVMFGVASTAQELGRLADEMHREVGKFKV